MSLDETFGLRLDGRSHKPSFRSSTTLFISSVSTPTAVVSRVAVRVGPLAGTHLAELLDRAPLPTRRSTWSGRAAHARSPGAECELYESCASHGSTNRSVVRKSVAGLDVLFVAVVMPETACLQAFFGCKGGISLCFGSRGREFESRRPDLYWSQIRAPRIPPCAKGVAHLGGGQDVIDPGRGRNRRERMTSRFRRGVDSHGFGCRVEPASAPVAQITKGRSMRVRSWFSARSAVVRPPSRRTLPQ